MDFVIHVSVVVMREDRIALVREGKPTSHGKWNLPGGHLEPGEPLIAAAQREVREEIGQELELTGYLGVYTGLGHAHYLNFIFIAETNDPILTAAPHETIINHQWARITDVFAMDESTLLNPRKLKTILTDLRSREPYTLECIRENVYS